MTNSVAAADDRPPDVHLGGSSTAKQICKLCDACSRLVWQRAARKMLFIARWSRIVRRKHARRAIPIEQLRKYAVPARMLSCGS